MRRLFLSLWLVLIAFVSVTTLPMPCMGDGAGHACQTETCTCVAACTCKLAHDLEQTSCHSGAPSDPLTAQHLSPPRADWQADLPTAPELFTAPSPVPLARTVTSLAHPTEPHLNGPEKPPRSTA